jgi:predicted secreted Zn-dependent protease
VRKKINFIGTMVTQSLKKVELWCPTKKANIIKLMNSIYRQLLLILFIILAVIAILISDGHTAPHVNVAEKYYSIHGRTAYELRQQMNKHGAKTDKGKTHDAITRWHVKWRFDFRSKGNYCAIRTVQTSIDVIYNFPKWSDEADGPKELRDWWRRYLKALKKHEDGHRDIGISAAAEIEKAIGALRPEVNCHEMEIRADNLGESILKKFRRKEWIYDITTVHGMTQGAVFR